MWQLQLPLLPPSLTFVYQQPQHDQYLTKQLRWGGEGEVANLVLTMLNYPRAPAAPALVRRREGARRRSLIHLLPPPPPPSALRPRANARSGSLCGKTSGEVACLRGRGQAPPEEPRPDSFVVVKSCCCCRGTDGGGGRRRGGERRRALTLRSDTSSRFVAGGAASVAEGGGDGGGRTRRGAVGPPRLRASREEEGLLAEVPETHGCLGPPHRPARHRGRPPHLPLGSGARRPRPEAPPALGRAGR